ncbi:MAG: ribonuclease HII [Lachnospiraceae bacterium]
MEVDLYSNEKRLWNLGYENIAGCDEAGRGPLFGPVVAASVILPHDFVLEGLNDSKKLSEKKREKYYPIIMEKALAVSVSIVEADEIDKINIYEASRQGMLRATNSLKVKPDYIITDAMPLDGFTSVPHEAIIKGDAKSITIAAASVIAKVTRDRIMYEIDKVHPEYEFKKHKGYPTKKHLELIEKYGIIDGYRRTYGPVKKYIEEHKTNKEA